MSEEYYKILELDKNANDDQIKKAFRKVAMKHHPDKGGDENTFKKVNEAYSVLSDPEKRKIYDTYGKDGLDPNHAANQGSMFDAMFGGVHRHQQSNRTSDQHHAISVSLEDVYNGKEKHIRIERRVFDKSKLVKCGHCNGRGVFQQTIRMGPMITQSVQQCPKCNGSCYSLNKADIRIVKEDIVFQIPPGCKDGVKIVIQGKTNMEPGKEPGDLVLTVQYKKHKLFTVDSNGVDLIYKLNINLYEALNGFKHTFKYLDGTYIQLFECVFEPIKCFV